MRIIYLNQAKIEEQNKAINMPYKSGHLLALNQIQNKMALQPLVYKEMSQVKRKIIMNAKTCVD
jgi:hypothetical protein